MSKMKNLVKVTNLKPGMVIDHWDLLGDDAIIESVKEIVRPGMKYNLFSIRMKSGRMMDPGTTEKSHFMVRK